MLFSVYIYTMRDINNPLIKSYYDLISPLYPCYEGEEPDDVKDKLYVVIGAINSSDDSPKSSNNVNATIQVTINSWEVKYNNKKALNEAAGAILTAIQPQFHSTLQITGAQVVTTKLTGDRDNNYGKLAGRVYVSRVLTFSHLINYSS